MPIHRHIFVIVAVALPLALAGCAGGGLADELSARPEPRALGKADVKSLRIPQDDKFSITAAPAQKAPGLSGSAEATASAKREGSAEASAKVENGGTASAAFQLGHGFTNDSERQIDLHVNTRFAAEYAAGSSPPDVAPNAAVSLILFARDGRNRLRQQVTVVGHALDAGSVSSKDNRDVEITVTLGPGESINVYLAGSVVIENRDGQKSSGSLKLSNVEMEVRSQAAPAVRAASQPNQP